METKLKLKHGLALHSIGYQIIESCVEQVKAIPEYTSKRNDVELATAVCKLIQRQIQEAVDNGYITAKQAEQLDKGVIVVEVMNRVYELDDDEVNSLRSSIEFLVNHKLLKDKKIRRSMVSFAKWCLKKVI